MAADTGRGELAFFLAGVWLVWSVGSALFAAAPHVLHRGAVFLGVLSTGCSS